MIENLVKQRNMKWASYFSVSFLALLLCTPPLAQHTGGPSAAFGAADFLNIQQAAGSYRTEKLRVLASASTCGDISRRDHDGVGNDLAQLEASACALVDTVGAVAQADFMVFDYGMYPLLTFKDDEDGADAAFQAKVNEVEQGLNAEAYLLVGKHINPSDKSVAFRVKLRLPDAGQLAGAAPSLVEGAEGLLLSLMAEYYGQDASRANQAEALAIDSLARFLNRFGDMTAALDESLLAFSGFSELPSDLSPLDVSGDAQHTPTVRNYAGISSDGQTVNNMVSAALLSADIAVLNISVLTIITDTDNYDPGNENSGFAQADRDYRESGSQLAIWFHYHIAEEGEEDKMFLKVKNNLSEADAEGMFSIVWANYLADLHESAGGPTISGGPGPRTAGASCPSCLVSCIYKWTAKKHLMPCINLSQYSSLFAGMNGGLEYLGGIYCGMLDEILETVYFLADLGHGVINMSEETYFIELAQLGSPMSILPFAVAKLGKIIFKSITDASYDFWGTTKRKWENTLAVYEGAVTALKYMVNNWQQMLSQVQSAIAEWWADLTFQNETKDAGYQAGKLIMGLLLGVLTTGASSVKVAKAGVGRLTDLLGKIKSGNIKDTLDGFWWRIKDSADGIKCKLLAAGCFLAGTPVLMAGGGAGALGPVAAVPIEEVGLLEYAVSHSTVNAGHGLASAQAAYWAEDPFTSAQQRQRDRYALDSTSWYEAVFEELVGHSSCRLALHHDWIAEQGYEPGLIVEMNLPEQGISGPFRITSIKHILPQKRPEEENLLPGFAFRPVTGIFAHRSADVLSVALESGDTLGVTSAHPIYSLTYGGWRLAGELEPGEEVLAYAGSSRVASVAPLPGAHRVYNLEVQGLHNFLVGELGVVVHNSCWDWSKTYRYSDGWDLPENHIFARHAHNSTWNQANPNRLKSEFAQQWSSNIDDLKVFIELSIEDGVATLSNLVQQGPNKWAATIDLTDVLEASEYVGRKRGPGGWINTKKLRVVYDDKRSSFVTAFPD